MGPCVLEWIWPAPPCGSRSGYLGCCDATLPQNNLLSRHAFELWRLQQTCLTTILGKIGAREIKNENRESKASARLGVAIVNLNPSPALIVLIARQVQKCVHTNGGKVNGHFLLRLPSCELRLLPCVGWLLSLSAHTPLIRRWRSTPLSSGVAPWPLKFNGVVFASSPPPH